jgi:hypothetical protein
MHENLSLKRKKQFYKRRRQRLIEKKVIKRIKNKEIIYRYSPWNEYSEKGLKDRTFWFSKPDQFNDPFDCNMEVFRHYKVTNSLFNFINNDLPVAFRNPMEYFINTIKEFGVLCFTKSGDIGKRGYDNLHFWSLYANNHKGVALGFKKTSVEEFYSRKYFDQCSLQDVIYKDSMFDYDNDYITLTDNTKIKVKDYLKNVGADPKAFDQLIKIKSFLERIKRYGKMRMNVESFLQGMHYSI